MRSFSIVVVALCFISLAACDRNRVYEDSQQLPKSWDKDSLARFEVPIEDSLSVNSVYITVRNASEYPYSNLYLFVTTVAPSGAYVTDTLECILADDSGKWLGKGFAKYWDHRFPMRKNVKFPEKGKYTISVQQGMRDENLVGIHDVGVRIEKTN